MVWGFRTVWLSIPSVLRGLETNGTKLPTTRIVTRRVTLYTPTQHPKAVEAHQRHQNRKSLHPETVLNPKTAAPYPILATIILPCRASRFQGLGPLLKASEASELGVSGASGPVSARAVALDRLRRRRGRLLKGLAFKLVGKVLDETSITDIPGVCMELSPPWFVITAAILADTPQFCNLAAMRP